MKGKRDEAAERGKQQMQEVLDSGREVLHHRTGIRGTGGRVYRRGDIGPMGDRLTDAMFVFGDGRYLKLSVEGDGLTVLNENDVEFLAGLEASIAAVIRSALEVQAAKGGIDSQLVNFEGVLVYAALERSIEIQRERLNITRAGTMKRASN